MPDWRIGTHRGKLVLEFEIDGKRVRRAIGTDDPRQAELLAPAFYAELTRPKGTTVADLWQGFRGDRAGKAVLVTMVHTWKALSKRFGHIQGDAVTIADCRAHTAERRKAGIKDGTIHTELGHLRMVLLWAKAHKLISEVPTIERPSKPEPKDRWLTKMEARRLLHGAKKPHLQVAIHLMLATAGRISAVLELTWDRVDFQRRLIYLRNPEDKTVRKGRAVVPINRELLPVLRAAKEGAVSDYVVEWNGRRVLSIKKGMASASKAARLDTVTPHVLRHSAAVWMAEGGSPMSEIAQYLGHSKTAITEKVYARFSPDYLREAASHLEFGLDVVPLVDDVPEEANRP